MNNLKIKNFFPKEEEDKIIRNLVNKWIKSPSFIKIFTKNIPLEPSYPFCFSMGVIGKDWPGFSTAILGAIHEKGWNVSYESGFILEVNGEKLGIIIIVVEIRDENELKRFQKDKKEIIENIFSIGVGTKAKEALLSIEAKRLEVYSKVTNIIKKSCKEDFVNELLAPEGEAFKFFASRTKAYITERRPEDLAEQIIMNYKAQKEVKRTNGKIQVYIKNLKTVKENLTGITVGVYEKDIHLKAILDSISFVLPDSRIVYNKEFVTPEGILIARIEITNKEGKAYPPSSYNKIKRVLEKIHRKGKETPVGLEHYLRAIIPRLITEFEKSKIPQVYFSLTNSTEFFLEFKILIVIEKEDAERKSRKIIAEFNKIKGLTLLSSHQLRQQANAGLLIFDVKAELDEFEAVSELYQKIKEVLIKNLGKIRDFDEGMREMDAEKVEALIKDFPDVPEKQIEKIYYSLEDFWRISTPSSELSKIMRAIYKLLSASQPFKILYDVLTIQNGTIMIFISSKEKIIASKLLKFSMKFNLTLSRIELEDKNILIALISKEGKPIEREEIEGIISRVMRR
ncbi:MAG: hypothetical protein ABIN61_03075 [candidate division WOR-3 bacterium]